MVPDFLVDILEITTNEFISEAFIISAFSDGGQSNRLFLILAIGLIGLICLGLLGLGATFFFRQNAREQAQALATTPLPPTPIPATFTPSATPSATPTETPLPTSTNTPVVNLGGGTEEAPVDTPTTNPNATATNTAVVQTPTLEPTATPTPPPEIPTSGGVLSAASNSFLEWIGSGLLLILIIYGILHRFKLFQGIGK